MQTAGWVYTDLESFSLQDATNHCGVALDYPEAAYERHKTDAATQNFETQLAKAKHGSFNTKGQVFAVIQGKLSTEPQWRNNIGSPGTFLIEVVICSTDIAMETTTPEEAVSQCRREGKSK